MARPVVPIQEVAMDVVRSTLAVAAGAVIEVAEKDYCYGMGLLRLQVAEPVRLHPSQEWAPVVGLVVWSDGSVHERREVLVRAVALRKAQR